MPKFQLNKLVRDKIVDDQIARGQKPDVRVLSPEEHRRELLRKIIEEVTELQESSTDKVLEELADIRQAYNDLVTLSGFADDQVTEVQHAKAERSGGFLAGKYITTLETSEDDKWTEYYRGDPERFPEVD